MNSKQKDAHIQILKHTCTELHTYAAEMKLFVGMATIACAGTWPISMHMYDT